MFMFSMRIVSDSFFNVWYTQKKVLNKNTENVNTNNNTTVKK